MKQISKEDYTWAWKQYSIGKDWNDRLEPSYYDTITTNWEMYNGNQWLYAKGLSSELPKPVFNIIKRAISFFIASMTSSAITGVYTPLLMRDDDYVDEESIASDIASASLKNFFDRVNINRVIRDLYLDAAVTGDMAVHLWFNTKSKPYGNKFPNIKGQIELEIIDGNNIYFGNPNSVDVQSQPYILIYGRDTVKNIQEEFKKHKKSVEVVSDKEYEEQSSESGKIELDSDQYGKVGYLLCYKKKWNQEKEDYEVWLSKSLIDNEMYDINTGLSYYPISFNNWERQKNNYHGRSLVTDIVPNQIFINRAFAMAMYHLMLTAFPKAVYDVDAVSGWTNELGTAIPIERTPGENIFNVAGYLQPATMSPQIIELINMVITYTKEMIGANDALLGNINPERASSVSITATARQSGVPLERPKSNIKDLLGDVMKIYADMAAEYYGTRPVVVDSEKVNEIGQVVKAKEIVDFNFRQIKDIPQNTKVNIGSTSYWDEIAQQHTMDSLLGSGMLEMADYLEVSSETMLPMKDEIIKILKNKASQMGNLSPDQVMQGNVPSHQMQSQMPTKMV